VQLHAAREAFVQYVAPAIMYIRSASKGWYCGCDMWKAIAVDR
jgi:hypothetical protein